MRRDPDLMRRLLLHFEARLVHEVDREPKIIDTYVFGLSWAGHEFLDAARDEGTWQRAKKKATAKGGGIVFDVLKAVLISEAKQHLGL